MLYKTDEMRIKGVSRGKGERMSDEGGRGREGEKLRSKKEAE